MARIEDDGELIPRAKKHLARTRDSHSSRGRSDRLAQLWPEPDWCALAAQRRYAPATLAALAVTYWSLGTSPMDRDVFEVKAHEWPALYDGAIAIVHKVFSTATNESLQQLSDRANQLAGLSRNSSLRDRMRLGAAGRFGGRTLYYPFNILPKLGWLFGSMPELGWPASDDCLKTGVGVVAESAGADPAKPVWMVITTSPRLMVLKGHRNMLRDEALQAARQLIAEKLQDNAQGRELRKTVTTRASADLGARQGPDYLRGRDISTQELMHTFRLRGIQFGESLSDKERQRWVNEAYCALQDLSRVTGFQPGWIGLGRRDKPALALAIGARGQGGAMAHFEPHLRVINLTRDRGAGSLAHEWGHALDQHLVQSTFSDGLRSYEGYFETLTEWRSLVQSGQVRRAVAWDLYTQLANAILGRDNNPFLQQARNIEALKGARKRYWTAAPELFARSFESYVQDRLQAAGQGSPWLVHGTLPEDQADPHLSPYPLQPQRQAYSQRWLRFMQELASMPAAASSASTSKRA